MSLYFGCWGVIGHYLWTPGATRVHDAVHPWGRASRGLDAMLAPGIADRSGNVPPNEQHEGVAALHHRDACTALAFWDRSVDQRPGSNSVFIFDGTLTFTEAARMAHERFPDVWERFTFDVRSCMEVPK